jgi:hypothetical protein
MSKLLLLLAGLAIYRSSCRSGIYKKTLRSRILFRSNMYKTYPGFKIIALCCTLRSGLHEIPTVIRTFPHGLENNHACKWFSDNFPRMLTYMLFLENCLKSVCMHGCSPIHVESYFSSLKYGTDLSPRFYTIQDLFTWIGE